MRAAINWRGSVLPNAITTNRFVPWRSTDLPTASLDHPAISWADTERGRGPTGTAARTGTVQVSRDLGSDPRVLAWRAEALSRGYASSIALPLVVGPDTFGVLSIYSSATDAFDEEEFVLLQELAADLSFGVHTHRSILEHRLAAAQVERLANFDPLTELPNRVQLIAKLEQAIERERSGTAGVALMMLSVDRFSEIQEGVGIVGADELLKKVALRLESAAEAGNFIARIADDSFVIVIPQADAERAHELAKRIQRAMTDPFELAGSPSGCADDQRHCDVSRPWCQSGRPDQAQRYCSPTRKNRRYRVCIV